MQKLTKAEEEIMHIIWELGKCTVSDIRDFIANKTGAAKPPHSSISTIVRIVEEKGFLDHKAYGRTYEYFPIISKNDYSKTTINKFVNDYFEGSMNSLVSFLVKEKALKKDELTELLNRLNQSNND